MARAVGVAAGVALAAAPAPAVATVGAGATWPLVSAGVLVLAAAGAVVGWSRLHHPAAAPLHLAAAVAAPSPPPALEPAQESTPGTATVRPRRHTAPTARPSDLRAEIALLDAARDAASAGDGARALTLLRRYDATFPAGMFRPESAALQIEALARLGQTDRARALGRAFIATHPDSPLVARVRRATAAP
jgi:TolA-binding protein